jgi:hypothetical protein
MGTTTEWESQFLNAYRWEDLCEVERKLNRLGEHGWEPFGIEQVSHDHVVIWLKRIKSTPVKKNQAVSAALKLGGSNMAGQINVDTTNETVTVEFLDDKGDTDAAAPVATSGAATVVVFSSDTPSVATIAADSTNPLQGDVTTVAEGSANLSATLSFADGSPFPFASPAPVAVTVSAGAAVGDALVLSV